MIEFQYSTDARVKGIIFATLPESVEVVGHFTRGPRSGCFRIMLNAHPHVEIKVRSEIDAAKLVRATIIGRR